LHPQLLPPQSAPHIRWQAWNRPVQHPLCLQPLSQPHDGSQQLQQPQLGSHPQLVSQQSPQPQPHVGSAQHDGPVQPHVGMYDSQPQL
jgi:hypothetical protein